jgi:hypothetical protein
MFRQNMCKNKMLEYNLHLKLYTNISHTNIQKQACLYIHIGIYEYVYI